MAYTRFIQRDHESPPSIEGFPPWMTQLLCSRGITSAEEAKSFLNPSLKDLHPPALLPGMTETVSLLREAIARKDTILVYGDYDTDGVCAASILMETLHLEGASLAYRIPSRHTEGYGLNPDAVREIAQKAALLITVDCGISNVEEVALAKELGLTVIITDHHQPPETLPPADAIIDPLLGDYPSPYLCGAGVALKITQAMQGMEGVERCLDLAAIATVADIVPLKGENRVIVSEGLKRIPRSPRPGLQELLKTAGLETALTADDIAFRLAPRLNAAGRLGDAKLAVHLLLTPDPAKAANIARILEEANRTRQTLERETTKEALAQLDLETLAASHVVLVSGENWNPGLIGLTAGRLCERFHLPAVALSIRGDTAVGSCRSIPGINIYRALAACEDLLEHFGGHEQAAGLSVKPENIPALRERLESVIAASAPEETFLPAMEYDLAVPFRTWTPESLSLLSRLEPTGCGNPAPLFLLENAEVRFLRRVGKDGAHLKLSLIDGDLSPVEAIAFNRGDLADDDPQSLDLLYQPIENTFRSRTTIEARVQAINPRG